MHTASTGTSTHTERVQALADISRLVLCCHSNETRALIANPPNSAQLEDTPYHSSKLRPGPCPVSKRLAKQLSRKNFRFIRINWTAPKQKIFA